ncbi:PREDICTED: uncharacterized protein LOC109342399 [Lupinus angustifolius]|uniref:uncharacterized protein LOC109342399 n=1 Tax=Lupinus angustifolius TaxID=3871 RepID=UPI00092FACC1|nr:PREDICTED: uncharacterized protein LOC109342399 [Lupinus angustifolius]
MYHGRLVLAATSILIPTLLTEFYSSLVGGHSGFLRTYKCIAGNLYWVGMKKMVQDFVKKCDVCQRQKYVATSPAGLLQPLPIPDRIREDISLDFITGLPKSKGFEAIFVVVDRLSKYSYFLPLKHPYTARKVAEVFAKEVVPWAELWYNTTYHGSTGKTPFEVVYGRTPPPLVHFTQGETGVETVAVDLVDRDEALRQLKYHLVQAQQQMKKYANKKRIFLEFEVKEWVFNKLQPHRQHMVVRRINQKLVPRYYGPFPILARVGAVSYKVKLPPTARVHPVFHISQLKKALGDYAMEAVLSADLEIDSEAIDEPDIVLASRRILNKGQKERQWLIKWKNRTTEETT